MTNANMRAVQQTVAEFIEAFDHLDWDRFQQYFAADATAFFPFDNAPYCAVGADEIEARFKTFFEQVRTTVPGPPYLHLDPTGTEWQLLRDVALVTFHLRRPGRVGRRTLVLRRQQQAWKIVHLHASNMTC